MRWRRRVMPVPIFAFVFVFALAVVGCAGPPSNPEVTMSSSSSSSSSASSSPSSASPAPTTSRTTARTTATSRPTPAVRSEPSLTGDTENAWAFAPVDDLGPVTVEGSVPRQRAWSTSKVLVVAAYLQEVVGGDPSRLDDRQREHVTRALGESDMDSLLALRAAIPGDRGAVMTAVLRSIGDEVTIAPSTKEGTMEWTIEEQVRFMAALSRGEVVSPASSAYLLAAMQPVESQRWGLAGVGADAVKGGWLTPSTETRQMGLLDGYAVAVITDAVGPAVLQSDGDAAHVEQLDRLAAMLAERLASG